MRLKKERRKRERERECKRKEGYEYESENGREQGGMYVLDIDCIIRGL